MLLALVASAALTETAQASFPGVNGKIVFTNVLVVGGDPNDPIRQRDIYTMNADGTGQANLTNTPDVHESQAAWSPDGSKIPFVAEPRACCSDHDIYTMNADGSDRRALTDDDLDEGSPSWSPDGTKIVFSKFERGPPLRENYYPFSDNDLHVMNADGTGDAVIRPTFAPVDEYDPDWAPDDSKIVYRADRTGDSYSFDLHTVNPDGSGWTRLTFLSGDQQFGPSAYEPEWSPDAARIAFSSDIDTRHTYDIYVMNPDGSEITNLTETPVSWEFSPAWSPDGTKMAFAVGDGSGLPKDIHVVSVDGTSAVNLTNNAAGGPLSGDPDWQAVQNRPPDCSGVAADPSVLFPADRSLRLVTLGGSDPDGDSVDLDVTRVTQDEPVLTAGDTTTPDAAAADAPHQILLRAERHPRRDGRVYRVTFRATDSHGASCSDIVQVAVPRKKKLRAIDSAPPSYDSFGL